MCINIVSSKKTLLFLFLFFTAITGVYSHGQIEIELTHIEGGIFQMGSNGGDPDEQPIHRVEVSDFYMMSTEVTQELWEEVMGTSIQEQREASTMPLPMKAVGPQQPVYYVSWYEAVEFCNRLSRRNGLDPVYYSDQAFREEYNAGDEDSVFWNRDADGYRLPTEAEWEYAARGGSVGNDTLYSGNNDLHEVAWYNMNCDEATHRVGTKSPNELGLYDMSGNVWEWCWDRFGFFPDSAQVDPAGPDTGSRRTRRGGAFSYYDFYCRITSRSGYSPSYRNENLGLRIARSAGE